MTKYVASESPHQLEGRTIREVRPLTREELSPGCGDPALLAATALELDDGTVLFAASGEGLLNVGELVRFSPRSGESWLIPPPEGTEAA